MATREYKNATHISYAFYNVHRDGQFGREKSHFVRLDREAMKEIEQGPVIFQGARRLDCPDRDDCHDEERLEVQDDPRWQFEEFNKWASKIVGTGTTKQHAVVFLKIGWLRDLHRDGKSICPREQIPQHAFHCGAPPPWHGVFLLMADGDNNGDEHLNRHILSRLLD